MRVTVRYGGTLSDPSSLARLREDFQDIASIQGWPVDLMDREPEARFSGGRAAVASPLALVGLRIVVHPQTDPLWLTFDEAGVLTRLGSYALGPTAGGKGLYGSQASLSFLHQAQASIQTSIGGSALHLTVVGLLDYLKRSYMHDLRVTDDSGFWQERDVKALGLLMDGR